MYLMNVPPVAATQTKWRTCGPPGGYSLPICFNDSDTELSTRGTPISDKVQMIIESLRSTQSSLEMGDEIEENVPPGHEGLPQVCKVAMGSYVGPQSRAQGPAENRPADVASTIDLESSDSDSDDSVDRGIEEAILEYLKEKDDHKRKAEPCLDFLQSSKIPRKSPPAPEDSRPVSDGETFLIAGSQLPKSIEAETSTPPAVIPVKKHIKNRAFLKDNAVEKLDSNKSATNKSLVPPTEQTKRLSKTIDKVQCPVTVEVDEESSDSSSDDGIEEAIQRYQLERKEQQNQAETVSPQALKEESDSTSDDGIEEAIRCYQIEQLREKGVLSPFLHKQKPFTKSLVPAAVGSTSTENMKKHRLRKKKTRAEKDAKSVQHPPPSLFLPKSTLVESSNGKGNGLLLFEEDGLEEQPTPTPPKANTTAELMCAEAILDISKTVMPEAFHHSVSLGSCTPTESSSQSSPTPANGPDEESDGSSIDSEDGIEQEIRNFLEQKAQMQKLLPAAATQEPRPEKVKAKVAPLKKPSRLSLTQRRRPKEGNCSVAVTSGTDGDVNETSPESGQVISQGSQTQPVARVCKVEGQQSGDKSSSLDSDEDLDSAIKDLLKTKKKSNKKTRDLKRKSRVSPREEEPPHQGNASETKKLKPDPLPKRSPLRKPEKGKDDTKDKAGLSKKSTSQHKHGDVREGEPAVGGQVATPLPIDVRTALETKEDSSAVDSDDSIELEIRRFLAEKAKVSTADKSKDGDDASRNGTAAVRAALRDEDVKRENQRAEIPSIGPLSVQSPPRGRPLPTPPPPDISRLSSVQSRSPSLSEPADGAGAARTEQWRPGSGRGGGGRDVVAAAVAPQLLRVRPVASPNTAESIKWRQSLGLPAIDTRTAGRPPFHITSSKIGETALGTPPRRGGVHRSQTPVTVWSSARTGRAPYPCSAETNANATFRSPPVLTHSSVARQQQQQQHPHPRTPFARSLAPGHRSQCPAGGATESMVHMSKDKSVFVELESNRTNHVQVRSRERSEGGRERADSLTGEIKRESESAAIDDNKHLGRAEEEEFIDEADCESGSRRNPEKKQGFPTLSLSSAIDPGMTFRPCIALTTEERSRMFNRSYQAEKCKKGVPSRSRAPAKSKAVQCVKRKLQFIPVNGKNEAPSLPSIRK